MDYARHSLAVEETVAYTNTTSVALTSIPLPVEALRYPGAFQPGAIHDAAGDPLDYRIEAYGLDVDLPEPLAPGAAIEIGLDYSLRLPEVAAQPQVRPYPLGYTPTQANFGDWYPFIPPYIPGEGWLIRPAAYYGEHLAYDIADFDVSIRLEGGAAGLVVAAGPAAVIEARPDGEWRRYLHEGRRNFAWSVSPYYQVVSRIVETAPGSPTRLSSYYFAFHAEAGESLLDAMAAALPLYARLFGAYPLPALTGVQADFMDGMEYDGLFFLSNDYYNWHKDDPEDFLTALGAHETAHQWWLGVVGSDQAGEPWLDEALCTYGELLFFENLFPAAVDWWWTYRVNYYSPQGPIDISIYDVPANADLYGLYRNPVYLGGAIFLHELRLEMGDNAFFAALKGYAARHAYQHASTADFFEALHAHTSQDLSRLIRKFFGKPTRKP